MLGEGLASGIVSALLRPLLRFWLRKTEPQRRGTLLLNGLKGDVKIRWGPYAVPHICASNEPDLFMAQGYLHAQERLWQMELNRRYLSGRLAEVFGEDVVPWKDFSVRFRDKNTVDLDYFMRLMGIRRTALACLRILAADQVKILMAYCEGVNRYIETHLNCPPFEFRILGYQPEPWRPEDCITIAKGFALLLSTSLFTRLTLTAVADQLRDQKAKMHSLYPFYSLQEPCITRSAAHGSKQFVTFLNGTFQPGWAAGQGSNNWVIAPWRSSTGKAILCNDPHLRMTLPSVWYLMHLREAAENGKGDAFDVCGASVPGSPYVYLGHNRRIAWGVTAALCDDADLYLEKLSPQDPDRYLAGTQWLKMTCEQEAIFIRGGRQTKKAVRFTRHGPVISDFTQGNPGSEVLALRWTAHDPSDEMRAVHGVNRARNWEEFLESVSHQVAPTLNYVYADVQGHIGYCLAGRIPHRTHACSFLPLPGWSEEFDWKGYIPFNELPRLYDPPEGVIATANNRITDESYPYYLSDLFEPPYRIRRIKQLLSIQEQYSLHDATEIQKDVHSAQGREVIESLAGDLEAIARKEESLKLAAESLLRWDGNCLQESFGAALYEVFYHRLMENLLIDDLGEELFMAYAELLNQSLAPVDQILRNPQSPWFTNNSREALIEKSLREAWQELRARMGDDKDEWSWGRIHTLTLRHPLEHSRVLAPLISIGPFPSSGDGVTVNTGFYRHSNPYGQVVGASLRMAMDVGNWNDSRFILPAGQSGHFLSRHYGDQTELWRRGDTITVRFEPDEMREWPLMVLESPA